MTLRDRLRRTKVALAARQLVDALSSQAESDLERLEDDLREGACPGYKRLCRAYAFVRNDVWAVCKFFCDEESSKVALVFCSSRNIDPRDLIALLRRIGPPWLAGSEKGGPNA